MSLKICIERVLDMFVICYPAHHLAVWRAKCLNHLLESSIFHFLCFFSTLKIVAFPQFECWIKKLFTYDCELPYTKECFFYV